LPGILAALPKSLPFHPYCDDYKGHQRHQYMNKNHGRRRGRTKTERFEGQETGISIQALQDAPIYQSTKYLRDGGSFTLFFFVDCTNRQSLLAISLVSKWFQYSLNEHNSCNKVICIPNHPTQSHGGSILTNTGFYELPFHHSSRLHLLHLLNARRVPSIIVVQNKNGRVITSWGWEAIEKEGYDGGRLDQWIDKNSLDAKKGLIFSEDRDLPLNGNSSDTFNSHVVEDWKKGRSGLPCWWHLLHFVF